MGPLFFLDWTPFASLSFPSSSIIFLISSSTTELISYFFGQVELGASHTPLFIPFPSYFPFPFLVFMSIFIWTELRKTKLISPFSYFPYLVSPNPPELKLGTPLTPRTLVYCLFEVCATVTDTVFNCTYRCLLGIFTVNFI